MRAHIARALSGVLAAGVLLVLGGVAGNGLTPAHAADCFDTPSACPTYTDPSDALVASALNDELRIGAAGDALTWSALNDQLQVGAASDALVQNLIADCLRGIFPSQDVLAGAHVVTQQTGEGWARALGPCSYDEFDDPYCSTYPY